MQQLRQHTQIYFVGYRSDADRLQKQIITSIGIGIGGACTPATRGCGERP